ncbi:hypothetical protein Pmi06nite_44000 [Planotetraspora mira]|uniref:ATP-dependent Clp protease adapter protein ClpS n=1 Tax=Planotetraspora mira TaxID=58121 RepID=A0A8J3TR13_9ACTN|nr:hypothetical protein Pmi06nite_44000 [Planotetraspora mira]
MRRTIGQGGLEHRQLVLVGQQGGAHGRAHVSKTTTGVVQDGPVGSTAPAEVERPSTDVRPDLPWLTIVWNDPVNLMSYVTYVFQAVFGYPREKAEKLMMDVHHKGRAVVASGAREEMERDVQILHSYGLWATVQRDS